MSSISFDNPWLLLIAVPILVIVLGAFFFSVRKSNRNWHNVVSCVLHVLIAACVALSAAGMNIQTVVTQTKVFVLADVSYSVNKNLDKIDEYIDDLKDNLPPNSQLGIVCFGNDYEVLTPAGGAIRSVKEANVDDSGTDIVGAMNYVKNIYGNGFVKRMVVITDGKQSDESDPNALRSAVNELNASNIQVDAIFLDDNLKEGAQEAQIASVEYSKTAYKNREATVTAVVNSKAEGPAELYLKQNGVELAWEYVNLKKGRTYVDFTLPTHTEGEYEYEISLAAEWDKNPHDNVSKFTQTVTPVVSVLLVSDERSDLTAFQEIFGEEATLSAYIGVPNIPYKVEELSAYDEIILSNVNLATKNNCDMFVDSLLSVVNKLGKSLTTVGNLYLSNTQTTDGAGSSLASEALQKLSSKLPVDYGNGARDSKLVTFVFDESDSMFNEGKLARAQQAAKYVVDGLTEKDSVAIVYFHGTNGVQLSVTQLDSEENRKAVSDSIDAIGVKQGTIMSGGLEEAYTQIASLTGYEKQVILLSDGINSTSDSEEALNAWATSLYNISVPVSVIDVGRGSGSDEWANASKRLQRVASLGGGKYLHANTDSALEEFVFPQITDDVKDAIVNQLSAVNTERRFDGVLEGIDETQIPYVSGYVNTGLRASATTVLSTDYRMKNGATVKVPIYSYWKVGNGKIASFTSSLSSNDEGNWLEKWKVETEGVSLADAFFLNVLNENTPDERVSNPFILSLEADTGYCSLTLAHVNGQSGAEVKAQITAPDGTVSERIFSYNSSVYACTFATPAVGRYQVDVTYSYRGSSHSYTTYYSVSFLPEYDTFTLFDAGELYKMLDGNGTVSEDGKLTLVNDESVMQSSVYYLTAPLLITAISLFAVDIIVRKLKWEDVRGLFKRTKKGGKV